MATKGDMTERRGLLDRISPARWVLIVCCVNLVSTGIFLFASAHVDEAARRHNCDISEQGNLWFVDILAAQASADEDGPPEDLEARVAEVKDKIRGLYDECR